MAGDPSNKGVTWTVTSGAGTLASASGLTNTYTAPSTAVPAVTITATSVVDPAKSASTTVSVNSLPAFTSTGQLPGAFAGVAYSTTLASTGGTGARTYALAGGTLPAGLSLNATTGVISGTPVGSDVSTFSIAVTDSAATPVSSTGSFTLATSSLQITSPALGATVVGRSYTPATYIAVAAQGAVTWAVTAGSLPAGLVLSSTGTVSGTATAAGDSNFTVTATDAAGQTANASGTIHVAARLQLSGAALSSTQAGSAFAGYTVAASGGTAPYTYSLAAGSVLPQGVTLSSAGVLAGTPTVPGNYSFSVIAADANGALTSSSQTAQATFTLPVTATLLSITTSALDNAVTGSPYAQRIGAAGGVAPYTFSVSAGTLPPGLLLGSTGQFIGRTSSTGSYTVTVQVQDAEAAPQTASKVFTLTVGDTLTSTAGNSTLNGSYAFVFRGVSNGVLAAGATTSGGVFGQDMAGSLTFDGTSLLTGTLDVNDARSSFQGSISVTGSYAVGADQRGQVILKYGSKTATFDIATSGLAAGVASKFRMLRADADDPNNVDQVQGTGEAVLQSAAAFNLASLKGGYVFQLDGETPSATSLGGSATSTALTQFGALSAAGYIQLNGAGLIARGLMDAASYNKAYPTITLLGSYTAPDSHGRGTMVISTLGGGFPLQPAHFVYYVIGAKQMVLLSQDPHTSTSLMAGMAYQQQQTLFSTASLSGTVIASESGVQGGNGANSLPTTLSATLYVLKVTGASTMSGYNANNTGGSTNSSVSSPDSFAYTVSDSGRVTLTNLAQPGARLPVFWLYDNNAGVGTELANGTGTIGTLTLEGQTPGTYDTASVNGTYGTATTSGRALTTFATGVIQTNADADAKLVLDTSTDGVISTGASTSVTKAVEAGTGRFTLTGSNFFYNGYVLSANKLLFFNATSGFTRPVIWVAEK